MLKWIWKKQEKSKADRENERYDVSLRVKSRQLPGFRALTLDVSSSGVQLETEALLEKGQVLTLELEFDREELPDFTCPAEVMWAKGDDTRRQYAAGLAFRPSNDSEKLNLARMGAVLETRSEADIQDLLAEATKLDPTREAFFAHKDGGIPAHLSAEPEPKQEERVHPGLLIPLEITIQGYRWDRDHGYLLLTYTEGEQGHELFFPGCQSCYDHGCGFHQKAVGLYATIHSERLRQIQAKRGSTTLKHYRFTGPDQEPILDIISMPCQARSK